ncbi:MAG TPA: hypothetical protein QGF58_02720 [Myxococcota bacterium]|nr:hypothetical protein [Myxococcota bacterium]
MIGLSDGRQLRYVRGHDAFFCPSCQPDTSGRGFVDWRKLPSGRS